MDLFMFFAIYFAGFITAVKLFLTIIYWKEIKDWIASIGYYLQDIKDRIHCQWILWKHRDPA